MAYIPYKIEIMDDQKNMKKIEADRIVEEAAKPFRDKRLAVKTEIVISSNKSPAEKNEAIVLLRDRRNRTSGTSRLQGSESLQNFFGHYQ